MAERRVSFIIGSNAAALYSGLNKVQKRMEQWGSKMTRIGQNMSAKVTAPLLGIGAISVKSSADLETMRVGFESMLGSADKARRMMKDLTDFTAKTPFQLDDVGKATRTLLAFGTQAEDTLPTLKFLGDISAGANIPLGEMAQIYGKIQTKGKAMTEELLQLSERGIPIIDVLAKKFGVTKDQIFEMASQSKIDFATVRESLIGLTTQGGIFENQMEKQASTLKGLFSTLKDNVMLSLGAIGDSLVETFNLKELMTNAITLISELRDRFINLSDETKKRILIITAIIAGIGPALVGVGVTVTALGSAFAALTSPITLVIGAIAGISAAVIYLWDNWQAVKERLSDWSWWRNTLIDMAKFIIRLNPMQMFIKPYELLLNKLGVELPNPFDVTAEALDKLKVKTGEYEHEFGSMKTALINAMNEITGMDFTSFFDFGDKPAMGQHIGVWALNLSEQMKSVINKGPSFKNTTGEISDAMKIATGFGNTFTNSLSSGLSNVVFQGEKAINVFENIGRLLASSLIQKGLSILLTGGLSGSGLFGKGGGLLGKLFSGLGFANGGIPPVGKASIVGERGPELFIPNVSGRIIPNNQLNGMGMGADAKIVSALRTVKWRMEGGNLVGAFNYHSTKVLR